MSLRDEVARYEQLTGESAEHIPIIKIGAFLDGVDKGIEELEKVKTEINNIEPGYNFEGFYYCQSKVLDVIDEHIEKLKGENK